MAVNYFDGHLPSLGEETEADQELARQFEDTKNKVYDLYDDHAPEPSSGGSLVLPQYRQ